MSPVFCFFLSGIPTTSDWLMCLVVILSVSSQNSLRTGYDTYSWFIILVCCRAESSDFFSCDDCVAAKQQQKSEKCTFDHKWIGRHKFFLAEAWRADRSGCTGEAFSVSGGKFRHIIILVKCVFTVVLTPAKHIANLYNLLKNAMCVTFFNW